jgi:pyruvate/2-oxoglutarate/acetoin dehydrogenase E1 component
MVRTVAETIKEITKSYINKNKGLVIGQCLSAVGWVQNTVPAQKKNIIELPMTDIAGAGIAVGIALTKIRPIFILRFQSFLWLNASPLINHAAKAKEIFNYPAPVFIRAIASESVSSGPVHTNCYHSPFAHMPGLPICAPMTPKEYLSIWKTYLNNDDPLLVSEHRRSYKEKIEFKDTINKKSKMSLFLISASRFEEIKIVELLKRKYNYKIDIFHIVWLKPFKIKKIYLKSLYKTKLGLVVDSTYETCSISEHIAFKLMHNVSNSKVYNLGMKNKSPGCTKRLMNGTPSAKEIVKKINLVLKK